MGSAIHVLLPASAAHLVPLVREAGCVPVVDATGVHPPAVPDGAWVRTRPGRPAPGTGPVILAEFGAPVPDRPTWLETAQPTVPPGFAGIVLKGREAGGSCGEADGLELLAHCTERDRVILDAGVGPRTAGAVAAMGGGGVLLVEAHLACPEIGLHPTLARRLELPDAEVTRVVSGLRVCNSATAPVLRLLLEGRDPWTLADGAWASGDTRNRLWLVGQGIALARGLAERHGTLPALLEAYVRAWGSWGERVREARVITNGVPVTSAAALTAAGTAAAAGGVVGSGVLWEEAAWLGAPVIGRPLEAALAMGGLVVASGDVESVRAALLARAPEMPDVPHEAVPPASVSGAIAIIGVGGRFPGASDVQEFWANIVNGVSAIGEVPRDRWDPALYFDADPAAPDKSYTVVGGFLNKFQFEPKRFRIPPKVAKQIDPVQQITLASVADALADAGLQVDRNGPGKAFDRARTAVILGNSLGGEVKDEYAKRLAWPEVAQKLGTQREIAKLSEHDRAAFLNRFEKEWKGDLPEVDEDSMTGELSNVIAGRIANAFDLAGANFTVDAACASSMAAIQAASKGLQDHDFDLAITGGADRSMNISTYVKFCKIGALSPDHSAPFDASANGFVMGEGCGILVLKRYEEAVRDGDRIYAVIRGIGASSDGRGKGITAPNPQGQARALERAYAAAGVPPETIDLVECHGTSTVVGDKIEVEALSDFVGAGKRRTRGPIRIGSVKSMIGHLKSAAGAASVIKVALALHHGILPPSIGFREGPAGVSFDRVPLKVQTQAEPWPPTPEGVRRAGVSAFGFGGTNFHMVLESFGGQPLQASVAAAPVYIEPIVAPAPAAVVVEPETIEVVDRTWPEGLWVASARDPASLVRNLQRVAAGHPPAWNPSAPLRIAAAAESVEELRGQVDRAIKVVEKGGHPDLLRARSIYYEDAPSDGKLAMLFTGQGSQYLDMGLDLARAYPLAQATFDEADRILTPTLGKPITDFIRLLPGEDAATKEDLLRQTEYSQPATLAVDVAILRLLAAYGVVPDMVAGHSLGEYAAAVAAGIMTFDQALVAVSARGREMASIRLDDPGKMAGVAASTEVVEEILAEVDGYVIAANKNCPSQTVIAGASDAVDEACERFKARGITVYPLPVSHAFHSNIVAPASEPLKKVLRGLGLKPPVRPITTNVTAEYYSTGEDAVEQIIETLARQISAPVEWTAQIERMYEDGARVFVECGPKRALTGFVVSILKRRPHRALYTNHPKRGGLWSFRDGLAGLLVVGHALRAEPTEGIPDLFAIAEPKRATSQAVNSYLALVPESEAIPDVKEGILRIVSKTTGYDAAELDLAFELEADLGIDTVKQAEIFSVVRATYGIPSDPTFSFADHKTLQSVIDWAATKLGARRQVVPAPVVEPPRPAPPPAPIATIDASVIESFLRTAAQAGLQGMDAQSFATTLLPAIQGLVATAFDAARASIKPVPAPPPPPPVPAPAPVPTTSRALPAVRVMCTGASIGLPGGREVFGADNFAAILSGENRISHVGDRSKEFLDLALVRLVKNAQSGEGTFEKVESESDVIRLAGVKAGFDAAAYGLPEGLVRALDITSQLAIAAGIEALRDAGIPLVRAYKASQSGKKVPVGWMLPEAMRDDTGVIFASAFPGYDQLVEKLANKGDDGEGHFDRRFLFQILSMGHAQFAQLVGARGPNTAVNAACASTTQAIAIASDWIRIGRCKRVLVLGADDVTSDNLLKWIGGGFLAAGAATTKDKVEEAALPFDRRRHGMIIGMGAVGFVIETDVEARARGVVPIAELVGTAIANSAFHGTRLDPPHIASVFKEMIREVCATQGVSTNQIAASAMFMSHETYTPARGGSAAAEIDALRGTFGAAASKISIANTKGFTGHPMGAGMEDAIALKSLQYGIVPPVANFREPDEDLGDLRISMGERRDVEWVIRLSAGFGSQLALSVWRKVAKGDERVTDLAKRVAWLKSVTGYPHVVEEITQRTLRVVEGPADKPLPLVPEISPAVAVRLPNEGKRRAKPASEDELDTTSEVMPLPTSDPEVVSAPPNVARSGDVILSELVAVVAEKTGYGTDEVDPDFELEADLGIDTVKQAEIFTILRDRYGLERDEQFRLADYPTIRALAGWLSGAVAANPDAPPRAPELPKGPPKGPTTTRRGPITSEEMRPDASEIRRPQSSSFEPTPVRATVLPRIKPAPVDAASVLVELMGIVAAKTGYDPSDLEPEFELEADLGIDTVKQAEIFTELRDRHRIQRDEQFRLADHRTLRALATYLASRAAPVQPAEAPPMIPPPPPPPFLQAPTLVANDGDDDEDDDREEDTDQARMMRLDDITTDSQAIDPMSHSEFDAKKGFAPEEFDMSLGRGADDVPTEMALGGLPPNFRIRRPVLVDRPIPTGGSLKGRRIQVLGTDRRADAVRRELTQRGGLLVGPYEAVIDTCDDVMVAFRAAKQLDTARPRAWICLTRLGDLDGIYPLDRAFSDGARAGMAKAIGREWPQTSVRVLGFQGGSTEEEAGRAACDELADALPLDAAPQSLKHGIIEAFRKGGERRVIAYKTEDRPRSGTLLDAPVVLVTGGGRGISARVATELARRGPIRLALVGRGPMAAAEVDLNAEKEQIKVALKATGAKVTPVEIERRLEPLRKADEIRRNLQQMEALGAEAAYFRCDLGDDAAVQQMLEDVEAALGPVDVVLHGAGVEESRLVADKDEEAFHRVFDGKAKGGMSLVKALGPEVYFISMGSVAGRFGNAAQTDYSAANEAMARVCLTRPNSLHVDWTAWDDVGMAVRGGMRSLLADRGVELLPAGAGAALAVDLVAAGVTGEIVVAGKLGDFAPTSDHPLIDRFEFDGNRIRAYRSLALARDPWLRDHAIDEVAVLPGVMGIEMMAAAAEAALPGMAYVGAKNVRFDQPLKVHGESAVSVTIEAEPAGTREVRCKLVSERTLRTGRVQRTDHFTATILLGDAPEPEGLPSAFFPDEEIDAEAIYRRFFHGPIFRVLRDVQGVAADGLIGEANVEDSRIADFLLTEPLALEAAFQGVGLHRMIVHHQMALPASLDFVRVLRASSPGETLTLMVHVDGDKYHVDLDGSDGPILRLRGFAMIDSGPLPPGERFPVPPDGRPIALPTNNKGRGNRPNGAIARATPDDEPTTWLTPDELQGLRSRGTDQRVADRIAGRIAAKKALSRLTSVEPLAIRITSADSGEPVASVPGRPDVRVSISHRDGHAVAVAVATGRIGVDLERIAPRAASFVQDWFAPEEAHFDDPSRLTVVWAIKEAVQKALGRGMSLHPRQIVVEALQDGTATVRLDGEAAACRAALGGGPLVVRWWLEGDEVLAEVQIAA